MKLLKFEQTQEFKNGNNCTVREYPLRDKDINFSTAVLTGRYPENGYCVNEECKELIYVMDGKGTLNKKNEIIGFKKGDIILIDKGEIYYWDAQCIIAMPCTPAWYPEQHKITQKVYEGIIIEESLIDSKYMSGIEITNTEITHDGQWTLRTVSITKEKIQYLSDKIKSNSYYMHFWNNRDVIVIFKDKIFEINYDNKETWKEAIAYGVSIGIPKEQLDFPIK